MRSLLLGALYLCGGSLAFQVPVFSLKDLLQPTAQTATQLQRAVSEVGLIAIQHEDVQEQANALRELTKCIHSGAASGHAQSVVLKDHTIRTTLATSTNESHSSPFAAGLQEQCPDFVRVSEVLRAATATTGHAYARFLDQLSQTGPIADGLLGVFQSAVIHSESLEHFHLYHRKDEYKFGAEPTLRMHTDLGIFIVMTPPQYFNLMTLATPLEGMETGFRMKLPSGDVVTPEFPSGSLLVMNGEGAANWVHSPIAQKLYVPPHEVVLPDLAGSGRAWYGRMYLPPRNAVKVDKKGMTFNQYWTEGSAAVIRAPGSMVPLDESHRNLLVDQGNCSSGEVWCWMTCTSTANFTCSANDLVCTDDKTGLSWPENFKNATTGAVTHCFDCTLKCNASRSAATSSPSPASSSSQIPADAPGSALSTAPTVQMAVLLFFFFVCASI